MVLCGLAGRCRVQVRTTPRHIEDVKMMLVLHMTLYISLKIKGNAFVFTQAHLNTMKTTRNQRLVVC